MNGDYQHAIEQALAASKKRLQELQDIDFASRHSDNAYFTSGRADKMRARIAAVRENIEEFQRILEEK